MAALARGRMLRFGGEKTYSLVGDMVGRQKGGAAPVRWQTANDALHFGWIVRVAARDGQTFYTITDTGHDALANKGAGASY